MKQVYLIGGTMGVGKTTACRLLKEKLDNSVFLDGDWCWDMHPFIVNEETRKMVMENIVFLLNQFIHCSAYQHIIFGWVMHEQSILDDITRQLDLSDCRLHAVSLVCSPEALKVRLQRDIDAGLRQPDVLDRSIPRLPLYDRLKTTKIDVSDCSPEQAAEQIMQLANQSE